MFDSLSLPLSTLRERLLFLENCFLYITPEGPFGDIVADALALLLVLLWLGLVAWLLFWIHSVKFIASATLPFTRHDMAFGFVVGFACSGDIAGIWEVVLQFALTICLLTLCRRFGVIMFDDSGHTSLGNVFRAGITLFYGLEMFLIGFIGGFSVGTTFMVLAAVLVAVVALVVFAVNARRCARSVGDAARRLRSWFTRSPKRLKHVFRALLRWPLWVFVVCKRRNPVFRAFLRWLWRVLVVVAAFLAGLALLPECFVPALVTLFFFWLFFRAAKRACFLWPRVFGEGTSKGIRVWSAILLLPVSLMAVGLFLWSFYLAATPIRPLDYCPAPKEKISYRLKDERGNLPSKIYFDVGDSSCLPYSEEGWSNLLARVGNPPPPELRYVWIASRPDPFMESKPKNHLTALLNQRHTNLVLRTSLSDEDRSAVDDWLASYDERLGQLAESPVRKAMDFLANGKYVGGSWRFSDNMYTRDLLHSSSILSFEADGGTVESFVDALRQCDTCASIAFENDETLDGCTAARILGDVKGNSILRFSERRGLSSRDCRIVRHSIRTKRNLPFAQSTAIGICREFLPGEIAHMVHKELSGLLFLKLLFSVPDEDEFGSPVLGRIPCRFGEAMFFAMGFDWKGLAAGIRESQEWEAVRVSAMLDSGYHGQIPFHEFESPIRWLRGLWVRGGLYRTCNFNLEPPCWVFNWNRIRLVRSLFAEAHPAVSDAALQLAEFRAENGRDAESLEEASEAIGAEVPDTRSAFVDLRHERIAPPEGSVPGSSAYALALVPKATAPDWFREKDRIEAWLVVRNPAFPGTRPSRIYTLGLYDVERNAPSAEHLVAVEGTTDAENARLVIPAALFSCDAEAVEKAEADMASLEVDPHWNLK